MQNPSPFVQPTEPAKRRIVTFIDRKSRSFNPRLPERARIPDLELIRENSWQTQVIAGFKAAAQQQQPEIRQGHSAESVDTQERRSLPVVLRTAIAAR